MADRDNYRGYGSPSGRYYENREYPPGQDRDWQERDERGWSGGGRDRDQGRGGRDNDRGFFEKAGDEVRSWFSDDDRNRSPDGRGRDQHRGRPYGQDNDWNSDRNRSHGGQDAREPWGGGDRERSSGGYEASGSRYGGASNYRGEPQGGRYQDRGGYGGGQGGTDGGDWRAQGSHPHDDHYRDWRQQQVDSFDRDYDEYRRENRDKFHSEFSNWRGQRQQQRSSMRQVREHMDVVGSDGEHVGTVDKVKGDKIVLTKSDASAGGHHHSIPCSWMQSVDDKVTINKTAEQARQQWTDEENRRALFENDDQRQGEGGHMLNRSFSGTYQDR